MKKILSILILSVMILGISGMVSALPAVTTLFSDNFNDNNLAGWSASNWNDAGTSNFGTIYDSYYAWMKDDAILYNQVNTAGYEDINFAYCRRTRDLESGDRLKIGWKTGSYSSNWANWNQLESIQTDSWSCVNFNLPASAENTTIQIGFFLDNGEGDIGRIDNVIVTGQVIPDTTAPTISNPSVNPQNPEIDESVQICADVTDTSGVSNVKLSCSSPIHTYSNLNMAGVGDRYCTWFNTDTTDNEVMSCSITATDSNGNSDTTELDEFTYDGANPVAEFTCTPLTGDEPLTTVCTSTSTDTVSNHADLIHNWNYVGGELMSSTSDSITVKYSPQGGYTIGLTVTDEVGFSDTETKTDYISVLDTVPTAGFTSDSPKDEGSVMSFTDTSTTPYDAITSWAWSFGDGSTSTEQNPTHTYLNNGDYTVTLTVTDSDGSIDDYSSSVTVNDLKPIASFTSDSPKDEGSVMSFTDESTSYDSITIWAWSFGDGSTSTEQNPTHTYLNNGDYTVTLTVTDSDGSTNSDSKIVTVNDLGPTANLLGDTNLNEGVLGNWDASSSTSNPDAIVSYEWDWNYDGSFDASVDTGSVQSHTYDKDGTYVIAVKVTDDDGSTSINTLSVIVNNFVPVITNLPDSKKTVINEPFTFDVDATDASPSDTLTYSLVSTSGMTIDSLTGVISWTPTALGTYTATVSVFDGTDTVDGILTVNVYNYQIDLDEDWNLISIPLVSEDTTINSVLGSITSNANVIWEYSYDETSGKNIWKYNLVNDGTWSSDSSRVQNIIPGYGYYLLMNSVDTLYQNGEKYYNIGLGIPMPPQVELTTGWNLIGHYGLNTVAKSSEIQDLSGGILTDLASVNVLNQNALPANYLVKGEGYWAFITGQNNLLYAPSEADYSEQTLN